MISQHPTGIQTSCLSVAGGRRPMFHHGCPPVGVFPNLQGVSSYVFLRIASACGFLLLVVPRDVGALATSHAEYGCR